MRLDLDDANLVGDVEGVVVGGEAHVGLLQAIGSVATATHTSEGQMNETHETEERHCWSVRQARAGHHPFEVRWQTSHDALRLICITQSQLPK